MLKSMTAFSRSEMIHDRLKVLTEIRAYNSRHLDLVLRLPNEYMALEEKIKGLISSQVARGRVEIMLNIQKEYEEDPGFEVDAQKARAYHAALRQLKETVDIRSDISLDMFSGVSGLIKPSLARIDAENDWPVLEGCLKAALGDLDDMRKREGKHIALDLERRLDFIAKALGQIESESSGLIQIYQQRLKERIASLVNGVVEIDPVRIVQEAAILADKSDISEEIVRAKSHMAQFRAIMKVPEPSGRKLNFLLQEFVREFNTMGSKAASEKVSHLIVEVKSELEKMREQVQNIE
jgi:uncharacterized protein (TIGR00255 family)